jgi:hypothetical protein
MKLKSVLEAVKAEVEAAQAAYPAMHSYHEGYAILKEEVDELWDEIKKKQLTGGAGTGDPEKYQNSAKIRAEAVQVCAMAIRLILDCCENTALSKSSTQEGL